MLVGSKWSYHIFQHLHYPSVHIQLLFCKPCTNIEDYIKDSSCADSLTDVVCLSSVSSFVVVTTWEHMYAILCNVLQV